MSTRTYCVIPRGARQETSFFQGVFEDGVRVLYQGRLQSLVVSHVLSPAHDYVKHIDGPLLATLRDGGNATLIVATPNSEDPAATAAAPAQGPSSAAAPDPHHGAGLAESSAVAMELYANLLPLLFRNLAACAAARVAAVTVSASERVLLDNLREDRRIRALHEAHHVTITRSASASEWGTVLQLLEDRHVALAESPTALEGQTACVLTVELQGHGRLVVVDVASAQDLLQQLTLILHMHAEGAARTYPLHTPLRDLLERNVAPLATVQVLSVPAPQVTVRQSMRVLHFAAAVEAAATASTGHTDADRTAISSATVTSGRYSQQQQRGGRRRGGTVPVSPAASKLFTSPSPLTSSVEDSRAAQESRISSSPAPTARAAAPAMASSAHSQRLANSFADSEDGVRERTPAQLPPPSVTVDAERQRGRELHLVQRVAALEGQLRESEARCRRAEDALHDAERKHADVTRELRGKESLWADLQRAHHKAKQENVEYAQVVEKLVRQVRTLEREASRQTRQDATVVKQLRTVEAEKEQLSLQLTRLRREVLLFRKDATFRARQATLSRIVPSPASGLAVSAAASKVQDDSGPSPDAAAGSGGGGGRHSPRARRLYDSVSDVEGAGAAPGEAPPPEHREQQSRLTAITVDELRWRNTHLEQEVSRLQVRLLSALTAAPRPRDSRAEECDVCAVMQERVDYFQAELEHVRGEKDALLRLLASSSSSPSSAPGPLAQETDAGRRDAAAGPTRSVTRSPSSSTDHNSGGGSPARDGHAEPRGGVASASLGEGAAQRVAAALLTGCASLDAQLACTQMLLAQRLRGLPHSHAVASEHVDPASQLSPAILQEHQEAVAALAQSLRHIAEKPATRPPADTSVHSAGGGGALTQRVSPTPVLLPPVPRCATAADADNLTNQLSFESERCRHLRAFIPTFAQLAVATEHLAMRLDT